MQHESAPKIIANAQVPSLTSTSIIDCLRMCPKRKQNLTRVSTNNVVSKAKEIVLGAFYWISNENTQRIGLLTNKK